MATSRKKRTKPRAPARKHAATPRSLAILDGEWHDFITHAAGAEPVSAEWPDPTGAASVRSALRRVVKKKFAGKKNMTTTKKPIAKKKSAKPKKRVKKT